MKARMSLALILTGILVSVGSGKTGKYFERRVKGIEQSISAEVHDIREKISEITNLPSKEILNRVIDSNDQELVEEYRGLIQELSAHDPDLIEGELERARIYRGCVGLSAVGTVTGYGLMCGGVAFPLRSYLNSRRKRRRKNKA